jgi:tRNA(Arg) A34 adenosine deaminase TadA
MDDERFMKIAIKEAKKGDYHFGAVIVKDRKIISKIHNTANQLDPTAHAEVNAIRKACKKLNSIDLSGCTLYTTCEPCPMCFTAAWWAKISRIVYGMEAEDVKEEDWKINIKCNELNNRTGNKIQIKGGFLRDECLELFD